MINVTCQCGHTADLIDFTRTHLGGDLPPGHFQCPACPLSWQRKESEYRIITAGSESMIIPGKIEILPTERRL